MDATIETTIRTIKFIKNDDITSQDLLDADQVSREVPGINEFISDFVRENDILVILYCNGIPVSVCILSYFGGVTFHLSCVGTTESALNKGHASHLLTCIKEYVKTYPLTYFPEDPDYGSDGEPKSPKSAQLIEAHEKHFVEIILDCVYNRVNLYKRGGFQVLYRNSDFKEVKCEINADGIVIDKMGSPILKTNGEPFKVDLHNIYMSWKFSFDPVGV